MVTWTFLFWFLLFNNRSGNENVVEVKVPEIHSRVGENGVINLYVTVREGYHIQAHQVNDEFLTPTTIEIVGREIISAGETKFPPAKRFRLEGATDDLYVYDGTFKITISFKANKVQRERYSLEGKLHYQACNLKMCLRPTFANFVIPLTIR